MQLWSHNKVHLKKEQITILLCIVLSEILSIFHALVEYICFKNSLKNAIQTNGEKTPSNTSIPQPIQNDISIDSRTFAQLCNKVPINYNGMPHI